MAIVRSQLLYQGFIVSRWADEFDEARAQLAAWLAEGKLAHEETIMGECLPAAADPVALPPLLVLASSHCLAVVCTFCAEGFESIPTAFAALFEGGNTGKMLVQARL